LAEPNFVVNESKGQLSGETKQNLELATLTNQLQTKKEKMIAPNKKTDRNVLEHRNFVPKKGAKYFCYYCF